MLIRVNHMWELAAHSWSPIKEAGVQAGNSSVILAAEEVAVMVPVEPMEDQTVA
jgi:hypothetical protein